MNQQGEILRVLFGSGRIWCYECPHELVCMVESRQSDNETNSIQCNSFDKFTSRSG